MTQKQLLDDVLITAIFAYIHAAEKGPTDWLSANDDIWDACFLRRDASLRCILGVAGRRFGRVPDTEYFRDHSCMSTGAIMFWEKVFQVDIDVLNDLAAILGMPEEDILARVRDPDDESDGE
jgi:hypothetical protein